tara:strand:+ start:3517 stop:4515 length:999 start_codon:yes stop_codon:yes gene_type:complete
MKILIDNHHGALLKSFHYLFNIRFNADVYIPYGFEWLDVDKLYSNYPQRDTAGQMLVSWANDIENSKQFYKLTLDEFIDADIDVIVCSLLENYNIFKQIISHYNKRCKLVLHIGNNISPQIIEQLGVENLLSSSWPSYLYSNVKNKVFCRQEFSLEKFIPKPDCNIKSVANYKHILNDIELSYFSKLELEMKSWNFKCYGAGNRDGIIDQHESVMSESLRNFGFIYHYKRIDEGFGHVIHNAFACGKPVITSHKHMCVNIDGKYIGNTATLLFEPDVTILDISIDDISTIKYKLEKMSVEYPEVSRKVYDKFRDVVNFDTEFLHVKSFFERI